MLSSSCHIRTESETALLPVVVYFFGGGFRTGFPSKFNTNTLIAQSASRVRHISELLCFGLISDDIIGYYSTGVGQRPSVPLNETFDLSFRVRTLHLLPSVAPPNLPARECDSEPSALAGPSASTVTPLGLRVTLPVFEVGQGCYTAFLGASIRDDDDEHDMVWLALRVVDITTPMYKRQPPIYHCSWPGSPRCITISRHLVSKLGKESKSREIHISLRPTYREGAFTGPQNILPRLMASSPQRPFHFKLSSIARWERDCNIKLLDVKHPPSPWTKSSESPTILVFECPDGGGRGIMAWMVLVVGCCSKGAPSSPGGDTHYAWVDFYFYGYKEVKSLISAYGDRHVCERDHLSQMECLEEDAYQRSYESNAKITDLVTWRERRWRRERRWQRRERRRGRGRLLLLLPAMPQLLQLLLPLFVLMLVPLLLPLLPLLPPPPLLPLQLREQWEQWAQREKRPRHEDHEMHERKGKELKALKELKELKGMKGVKERRLCCNIWFHRRGPMGHIGSSWLEVDIRISATNIVH